MCYDGSALESLRHRVRECERAGVTLLCCPEGTLGGLADYSDAPETIALRIDGDSLAQRLGPLMSESVTVIVGFTEHDHMGRYYNSAAVYSQGRVQGIYRKQHPAIRRSLYSAGVDAPVFPIPGSIAGVLICRDSLDTSLAAELVQQGATVLCIPTNNAMPPDRGGPSLVDQVRTLDTHHATSFGIPVVRADVIGAYRGLSSPGATMVTLPDGRQLCARNVPTGELVVADV
jgi:predicted amidohydrolase